MSLIVRICLKITAKETRGIILSCIPDEKIQVNPRFWSGSEILF